MNYGRTAGIRAKGRSLVGRFDLVFARNFATGVYDKAFLAQLDGHGIPYELGGERNFMTPRNELIPALGLASA